MSWLNGPWRKISCLAHPSAQAQRRLWRGLLFCWCLALFAAWLALSVFTRMAEKAGEEAGQNYVAVAPLAAEVMDLRARRGQLEGLPPLQAAERVADSAGVGRDRLHLLPGPTPDAPGTITLRAQALSLRELMDLLRDLRVEAGLSTVSANLAPSPGSDSRMDLALVLGRPGG